MKWEGGQIRDLVALIIGGLAQGSPRGLVNTHLAGHGSAPFSAHDCTVSGNSSTSKWCCREQWERSVNVPGQVTRPLFLSVCYKQPWSCGLLFQWRHGGFRRELPKKNAMTATDSGRVRAAILVNDGQRDHADLAVRSNAPRL
jgi:hypothetical protein